MAEDMATDHSCHMLTPHIHGKEGPPLSPAPAEKMPGQALDGPSQVMGPLWPGAWEHGWRGCLEKERDIHHQEVEGGSRQTEQQMTPPRARPAQITRLSPGEASQDGREQEVGVCAPAAPPTGSAQLQAPLLSLAEALGLSTAFSLPEPGRGSSAYSGHAISAQEAKNKRQTQTMNHVYDF